VTDAVTVGEKNYHFSFMDNQVKKIPTGFRKPITDATRLLVNFPDCRNVKKLVNHRYGFRIRVGRYRVFFDYDDDGAIKIISIQEVRKRDDRTY